jgi:hypothetical protein
MGMKGEVKSVFRSAFRSAFRLSEKVGLARVWEGFARLDPYLPGPPYALVIADQYSRRDRFGDASRLLRNGILDFLGKSHPMPLASAGEKSPDANGKKDGMDQGAGKSACLRDLYAVTEALDLKAFLAFGTLLGHVRENGFIRNDGDLDIGIMYDPLDPDRIAHALSSKGFLIGKRGGSTWPCRIKCVHANGTHVDIIFFHRMNGKFQTYCEYRGRKIFRERACFGLKRAEFQSVQVWIPEKPEAFLYENYLDWRVPQARSHALFTSALTDFRDDMIRYFALRHLYDLLARRNRDHFEFFLDLFRSRNPSDPNWPEIQKAFQARYAR